MTTKMFWSILTINLFLMEFREFNENVFNILNWARKGGRKNNRLKLSFYHLKGQREVSESFENHDNCI